MGIVAIEYASLGPREHISHIRDDSNNKKFWRHRWTILDAFTSIQQRKDYPEDKFTSIDEFKTYIEGLPKPKHHLI